MTIYLTVCSAQSLTATSPSPTLEVSQTRPPTAAGCNRSWRTKVQERVREGRRRARPLSRTLPGDARARPQARALATRAGRSPSSARADLCGGRPDPIRAKGPSLPRSSFRRAITPNARCGRNKRHRTPIPQGSVRGATSKKLPFLQRECGRTAGKTTGSGGSLWRSLDEVKCAARAGVEEGNRVRPLKGRAESLIWRGGSEDKETDAANARERRKMKLNVDLQHVCDRLHLDRSAAHACMPFHQCQVRI